MAVAASAPMAASGVPGVASAEPVPNALFSRFSLTEINHPILWMDCTENHVCVQGRDRLMPPTGYTSVW